MKTHRFVYALNLWMARDGVGLHIFGCFAQRSAEEDAAKPALKSDVIEREYSVMWEDVQWFDAGRGRQVPVKIYYPAAGKGPFPVVLFSTALADRAKIRQYLGTHWAGLGYVSVYVEHLGSDEAVWRGTVQPKKHLKEAYENPATMRNRPLDMRFALDRLEQLKGEGDPLAVRLDFTRIGAAGYDLAAQTALALAGQLLPGGLSDADSRIRAVIAMSPPVRWDRSPWISPTRTFTCLACT